MNESEKYKVNESVHDFLLILCTSHKYGVVFKDKAIGLKRKELNSLMHSVLNCLDRPWEHSYASELVLKICSACPDLVKFIWSNMKPFLDPRPTIKWLKTIQFAKSLLNELQPNCVDHFIKEFRVTQVSGYKTVN